MNIEFDDVRSLLNRVIDGVIEMEKESLTLLTALQAALEAGCAVVRDVAHGRIRRPMH